MFSSAMQDTDISHVYIGHSYEYLIVVQEKAQHTTSFQV